MNCDYEFAQKLKKTVVLDDLRDGMWLLDPKQPGYQSRWLWLCSLFIDLSLS